MAEKRISQVQRKTNETDIIISLNLDGSGKQNISTGIGFFDHMLSGFTRHGFFDLNLDVKGDLEVDCHHTIEDTGIVLGNAISEALGDKKGIKRFGSMILPTKSLFAAMETAFFLWMNAWCYVPLTCPDDPILHLMQNLPPTA